MNNTKRGGKREGAGRKHGKETVVKTYRCYPEEVETIKAAISKVKKQLRYTVGVTSAAA
jgi:hypothetical protein